MKIEKFYLTDKFIGQQLKFIQRKTMLRPLRFRTEQAIKVAMIGYFKVASGYHPLAEKEIIDYEDLYKYKLVLNTDYYKYNGMNVRENM